MTLVPFEKTHAQQIAISTVQPFINMVFITHIINNIHIFRRCCCCWRCHCTKTSCRCSSLYYSWKHFACVPMPCIQWPYDAILQMSITYYVLILCINGRRACVPLCMHFNTFTFVSILLFSFYPSLSRFLSLSRSLVHSRYLSHSHSFVRCVSRELTMI